MCVVNRLLLACIYIVLISQRQRLEAGVGLTSGLTQIEDRPNVLKHLHPVSVMNQLYSDMPGNFCNENLNKIVNDFTHIHIQNEIFSRWSLVVLQDMSTGDSNN